VLNLPPEPGTTGTLMLALGVVLGVLLLLLGRRVVVAEAGGGPVGLVTGVFLAVTIAGAPYTLWRVVEDIRETAPISAEHARYVGAETKLIDGELAERIGAPMPAGATYYVAVAPDAYSEIRESLGHWLGYALLPRRRVTEPAEAEWIVTWGATPDELGLRAGEPRLVGRNRLSERERVYVAPAR
jgi:hypothetical protein